MGVVREDGQVMATELRVPLSDKTELIREAVEEGATLAAAAGARLIDPQLGRSLTANDSGAVADQFLRTARYAGEMMGLSEAVAASYAPPPEGMSPGLKVAGPRRGRRPAVPAGVLDSGEARRRLKRRRPCSVSSDHAQRIEQFLQALAPRLGAGAEKAQVGH